MSCSIPNTIRSRRSGRKIDLSRTTLEQALDQISLVTKSFWKPLSSNTIFVTVDNPTKRREYADQVVKVFYLSNVTAPQEMQEMLTVLRTVVDVQKVFNYTAQNALVVRAEADTMALVEKLIADLDKAAAGGDHRRDGDAGQLDAHAEYHRRVRVTGHHHKCYFRAAAGNYDARHPERHDDRRPTTTTTGTTATTTTPTTTATTGTARDADQYGYSAECAGPHLERGFLIDQSAGRRARSGAERFLHEGAAVAADSSGGQRESHAQDRREGSHGERQFPAGRGGRWRQPAGQYAVHLSRRGREHGNRCRECTKTTKSPCTSIWISRRWTTT